MKIKIKEHFADLLDNKIDCIAMNDLDQAKRFQNDLLDQIKQIPINPYQYRKSFFFDDDNIRDLIFKKDVIVFRITNDAIVIFGFI